MKLQPSPTSPKASVPNKSEELEKLYHSDAYRSIEPPRVAPSMRVGVFLLTVLLAIGAGFVGAFLFSAYGWTPAQPATGQQTVVHRDPTVAQTAQTQLVIQRGLLALYEDHGTDTTYFGGYDPSTQVGTALLLSEDGWAVTSAPVLDAKKSYVAITTDRKVLQVRTMVRDSGSALAYFHIDGAGYTSLPLGKDHAMATGEEYTVYAANSRLTAPSVLTATVADSVARTGILTSSDADTLLPLLARSMPQQFFGGCVTNASGDVVGVLIQNRGVASAEVVPAQSIRAHLATILQSGTIVRSALGVQYIDVAANPGVLGKKRNDVAAGALLLDTKERDAVTPKSAAATAKLQAGDVITSVDGRPLTEEVSLSDIVQQTSPGTTIQLTVLRAGKEQKIKATLASASYPQ